MANLFYLIGFLFIIHELSVLRNPKSYLKKIRSLKKSDETENEFDSKPKVSVTKKVWTELSEEEKNVIRLAIFSLFYFVWLVIGCCFSGQWIGFISLTAFGLLMGHIRIKYDKNTSMSLSIIEFDSFISALVITFLIINHFHNII